MTFARDRDVSARDSLPRDYDFIIKRDDQALGRLTATTEAQNIPLASANPVIAKPESRMSLTLPALPIRTFTYGSAEGFCRCQRVQALVACLRRGMASALYRARHRTDVATYYSALRVRISSPMAISPPRGKK